MIGDQPTVFGVHLTQDQGEPAVIEPLGQFDTMPAVKLTQDRHLIGWVERLKVGDARRRQCAGELVCQAMYGGFDRLGHFRGRGLEGEPVATPTDAPPRKVCPTGGRLNSLKTAALATLGARRPD